MAITAYFDESGTHEGSPILVVAGYISTTEKWDRFNGEWDAFLKEDCGGAAYFHSKDYIGKVADSISDRAIEIIGRAIECGGGVTMNPQDFEDLTTPPVRKKFGDAYQFCCQAMLETLIELPEVSEMKGRITYVFERGAAHWKKFDTRMHRIEHQAELKEKFRYNGHFFYDKAQAPPLQSSDVLANLMFRTYRDKGNLNEESLHPVLASLAGLKPYSHFLQAFDRAEIIRTLRNTIPGLFYSSPK
jgi:hypothetical protein